MKLLDLFEFVRNAIFGRTIQVSLTLESGFTKFNIKSGGFKPSWIVLHHSWSVDSNKLRDWDGIRKFHTSWRHDGDEISEARAQELMAQGLHVTPPWKDIAYNFGIEHVDGILRILDGRAIGEIGAHAVGFNDRSIGICLIGNFDTDPPSNDRLFILSSLCRDLQREFKIPRDQIIGHRETFVKLGKPVEKSCPGLKFDLDAFRRRLIDPA
jgi:hypothetical protein